jgi:hypothetical protein
MIILIPCLGTSQELGEFVEGYQLTFFLIELNVNPDSVGYIEFIRGDTLQVRWEQMVGLQKPSDQLYSVYHGEIISGKSYYSSEWTPADTIETSEMNSGFYDFSIRALKAGTGDVYSKYSDPILILISEPPEDVPYKPKKVVIIIG